MLALWSWSGYGIAWAFDDSLHFSPWAYGVRYLDTWILSIFSIYAHEGVRIGTRYHHHHHHHFHPVLWLVVVVRDEHPSSLVSLLECSA
jgi:hypothetical protein